MNKARRDRINKAIEAVTTISTELDSIMEDEQEAYDNTPESLQDRERAEASQTAIDSLAEAIDSLQEVETCLNSAIE